MQTTSPEISGSVIFDFDGDGMIQFTVTVTMTQWPNGIQWPNGLFAGRTFSSKDSKSEREVEQLNMVTFKM